MSLAGMRSVIYPQFTLDPEIVSFPIPRPVRIRELSLYQEVVLRSDGFRKICFSHHFSQVDLDGPGE